MIDIYSNRPRTDGIEIVTEPPTVSGIEALKWEFLNTWVRLLRLFAYTDLNSVCYNSITEQGQMFWIAAVRGRYGSQFDVLSMLSISPGI
jgi:hypothetical protein